MEAKQKVAMAPAIGERAIDLARSQHLLEATGTLHATSGNEKANAQKAAAKPRLAMALHAKDLEPVPPGPAVKWDDDED